MSTNSAFSITKVVTEQAMSIEEHFRGNACIDRVGDAYLFDLTIPDEGFTCPAQPIRFSRPAAQADADRRRAIDVINRDPLRGQLMRVQQK